MAASGHNLRLLFWEITAACNLNCKYCRGAPQNSPGPQELSTEEAFALIEEVASFASPLLVLSGGEPLLRSDIYQIAGYARGKGLTVALATNGTLVTKDVARQIKEAGVNRVSVSLDAASPETHDALRGAAGSYKRTLRGLANLENAGVEFQINTTITRTNLKEIEAILALARNLGAIALHIFFLVPVGCGAEILEKKRLTAQEGESLLNWIYEQAGGDMEIRPTCASHYSRILYEREGVMPKTKGCLAGSEVCFISATGRVYPCGYLPLEAGNIRENSLEEIWLHSPLFTELRDRNNLKGKCGQCEYRQVCGGCRARAYAKTGDYLNEDASCDYAPHLNDTRLTCAWSPSACENL